MRIGKNKRLGHAPEGPPLDDTCFTKLFPGELSHSVGAERFLREIDTAKRLTHPNIVPVYDAGEAERRLFYVMPLIEGAKRNGDRHGFPKEIRACPSFQFVAKQ